MIDKIVSISERNGVYIIVYQFYHNKIIFLKIDTSYQNTQRLINKHLWYRK